MSSSSEVWGAWRRKLSEILNSMNREESSQSTPVQAIQNLPMAVEPPEDTRIAEQIKEQQEQILAEFRKLNRILSRLNRNFAALAHRPDVFTERQKATVLRAVPRRPEELSFWDRFFTPEKMRRNEA